ncbi:MAG: ABC transporter substrate-binding protein [Bdellovibrionota bacterium]|nr:MAG: ABC transporter substrate-binding protein [Bdellovibrionota bacterium]
MIRLVPLIVAAWLIPLMSPAETRIGVILPLSGGTAVWGEGIRRGIELADKSNPGSFHFIFEDEYFCDSAKAVAAAKKLLELDSVRILITGCLNGTKAIAPLARSAGVPIFSAGFLDQASLSDSKYIISLSAQIGSEAAVLARQLRAVGFKKIALFRHDDSFTGEFMQELAKGLQGVSAPVLTDYAVIDATFPWSSKIALARSEGTDAFLVYLGQDELLSFMRARRQLKDATAVFSGYIIESNFNPQEFGTELNGIRYTYPQIAEAEDGQSQLFRQQFEAQFGNAVSPSINAYFVFDGLTVLASALRGCRSASLDCLWPHFHNAGKHHRGVSGSFRFLDNGAIERAFILKEVQGSTFIPIGGSARPTGGNTPRKDNN